MVFDALQVLEWNCHNAIGRLDGVVPPGLLVEERYTHAVVGAADGGDLAAKADDAAELVRKRLRDAVHAADRLKHRGLLREILLEQHGGPHVGVEQHAQRHRIEPYAGPHRPGLAEFWSRSAAYLGRT